MSATRVDGSVVGLVLSGLLAGACGPGGGDGDRGGYGGNGSSDKDGWGSPVTSQYPEAVGDPGSCLSFDVPDHAWGYGLYGYWTGDGLAAWLPQTVFPKFEQPSFLVIKLMSQPGNWYGGAPDTLPTTVTFGPDAGAEASMDTCTVCPVLVTNVWGDNPTAVWYPIAGTLSIDSANLTTHEIRGSLDGVVWKRIGIYGVASFANWIDGTDSNHPEQPSCAFLSHSSFDSRAIDGRPCAEAGECPNQFSQVCDADTATCVASQCDSGKRWDPSTGEFVVTDETCPSDRVCEISLDTDDWYFGTHIEHAYSTGACVLPCDPAVSSACPPGLVCESTDAVVGQRSANVCHVP